MRHISKSESLQVSGAMNCYDSTTIAMVKNEALRDGLFFGFVTSSFAGTGVGAIAGVFAAEGTITALYGYASISMGTAVGIGAGLATGAVLFPAMALYGYHTSSAWNLA